jgi:hypothetical protein
LISAPHFAQTFFDDDAGDKAWSTLGDWPDFSDEIPVLGIDRLEDSAGMTGLPPDVSPQLASAVYSLVLGGADESEIFDPVVLLVFVLVVEAESWRDSPVDSFPNNDMLESESSVEVSSEISLAGDMAPICPFRFRPAFSHEEIIRV